jgi:branched-chain amino acid transport system permease protein
VRIGHFTTNYAQDEAFIGSKGVLALTFTLFILIVAFPFLSTTYWLYLGTLLAINVISTIGLNITTGYTGLLSLGHGAFMGVGAYTAGYLSIAHGLPVYVTIPLAGIFAAVVGAAFGLPSLRIRGLYLVIATLAAQFILGFVFQNWTSVTGGLNGLKLQSASIGSFRFDTDMRLYYLVVVPAVGLSMFAANLFRTRVGRAFVAIRERDLTAEVLGVHLTRYKLASFALGAFYAGIAGGLMAYLFRIVTADQYALTVSVFFLSAVVVGGMGSIFGSFLGALFMTILPEALRALTHVIGMHSSLNVALVFAPLQEIVFGVLLVFFLVFEPRGLVHIWQRVLRIFRLWPFRT